MAGAIADATTTLAPSRTGRYRPISDYAVVGNCRTIALISAHGSIDFLCLPRFDSPTVFASILDAETGGCFSIRPTGSFKASRRYVGPTNVLEITFTTDSGEAVLTDCMPVSAANSPRTHLWPDHELIRRIHCTRGRLECEVLCDPRPKYARTVPTPRRIAPDGWTLEAGAQTLLLRSGIPLAKHNHGLRGVATLHAGEHHYVSLSLDSQYPAVLPSLGDLAEHRVGVTLEFWKQWSGQCAYRGPWNDSVLRSALALKLLTFAPSGAVVAAATTSLPEWIGAARNWDYRYCWLRDASFTTRALLELGYATEAQAFLSWLLHATRLSWPRLNVMYTVFGNTRLSEKALDYLQGYRGSSPVRIGNAAHNQLQLDTYGAVVDAAYRFVMHGGHLDHTSGRMLAGLGRSAAKLWRKPDEGIWEPRSGPSHHTLSKAMCCIAMERLLDLHERGKLTLKQQEIGGFKSESQAARRAILERGVDPKRGCFTAIFDQDHTDASLLLLSIYGFEEPSSPRMLATIDRVLETLSGSEPPTDPSSGSQSQKSPGIGRPAPQDIQLKKSPTPSSRSSLLYRYHRHDGAQGPEGAFGICGFWAVEALALAGRIDEATRRFEALRGYANDTGLLSEEIDPDTGAALGNFPQAFTHVGLINAAHTLAEVRPDLPSPPKQQAAGKKA